MEYDYYIYMIQCDMCNNPPKDKEEFIKRADKIRFIQKKRAPFNKLKENVLAKDSLKQREVWGAYKKAVENNQNIADYQTDCSDFE